MTKIFVKYTAAVNTFGNVTKRTKSSVGLNITQTDEFSTFTDFAAKMEGTMDKKMDKFLKLRTI